MTKKNILGFTVAVVSMLSFGCDGVDDQDVKNAIDIEDEEDFDIQNAPPEEVVAGAVEKPAQGPDDVSAVTPDPLEGWCCSTSTCTGSQCSGCVTKPSSSWCGSDQTWVDCANYRQVGDTVTCL